MLFTSQHVHRRLLVKLELGGIESGTEELDRIDQQICRANILICFRRDVGSCSEARRLTGDGVTGIHVRLIDFGSAVDAFSMQNLYPNGPSSAEQTFSYMPPEALFGNAWLQGPAAARAKYDMWTIGQTITELILGTPRVFSVYTVESKKLATNLLVGRDNEGDLNLILYRIITLSEFCITVPGIQQYSSSVSHNCAFAVTFDFTIRVFAINARFLDLSLMHLVRQLLAGDPDQRLTAQEALNHHYFLGSSRDLEAEQVVENDSKTPQRSTYVVKEDQNSEFLIISLDFKVSLESFYLRFPWICYLLRCSFCSEEPSSNIKLEMGGLRLTLCLLGLITYAIPFSVGMPEACLTVYNQGGASAVLQSPECSLWIESIQSVHKRTTNCHSTAHQWEINFLDQDVLCNLDMTIPLPGKYGTEEVRVWAAAVFDGHAGVEASEMVSKLLLDYFLLHSMFISVNPNTEGYIMVNEGQNEEARQEQHDVSLLSYRELPDISRQSRQRRIFEDVLVRSVNDIDSTFSKAIKFGAVGTVVVWVDGDLLVANVGDLEATLCSENLQSHEVVEGHSPNRVDEGERFVTAGAHVFKWKVSYWANGIISITRAIIRGFLESAGVLSEPEVTDSKPLTANDTRFVVAISSIFARLPPRKITFSETEKQELLLFLNQKLTSGAKGSYGV
ncbi:hypothetical protein RHMOL_Rhmol01G0059100 [Rhododendron molle]|uniref:Uncharacterized protein n=1 Tax=Rhododendron molle TaxID=49168 RepID=A0ACC0PZ29_RHOML|nr:hypothetical protein RHMOL_Rhmol01G0059100 [Rhododendron molle]